MSRAPLPNHSLIGTGVRGERKDPGEFRTSQNWIGPRGGSLADAAFVPPPISELDRLLGNFETFAREPGGCSLPSCWSTKGVLHRPLLYLSYFLKRHRSEYYDCRCDRPAP